ncbi:MAG TPA: hypothetical protein VND19_12675, partial [Acetobacteraceae bacterium]|nr:hypothetical protein [Acetobacteraceae bacterium]
VATGGRPILVGIGAEAWGGGGWLTGHERNKNTDRGTSQGIFSGSGGVGLGVIRGPESSGSRTAWAEPPEFDLLRTLEMI